MCKNNFVIFDNKCVTICPLGYYNSSNVCVQCSDKCLKCTDTGCSQCVLPYKLDAHNLCILCS
jgi:hypothetical protein